MTPEATFWRNVLAQWQSRLALLRRISMCDAIELALEPEALVLTFRWPPTKLHGAGVHVVRLLKAEMVSNLHDAPSSWRLVNSTCQHVRLVGQQVLHERLG